MSEKSSSAPPIQSTNTSALYFFPFPDKEENNVWKQIGKSAGLGEHDLEQLTKGLKAHVRFAILEEKYICKDHRNLHSNFYSKRFVGGHNLCKRLHFFNADIAAGIKPENYLDIFLGENLNHSYIGFCVIRPTPKRAIGRTVIDPSKIDRGIIQEHYCLHAEYRVHLGGKTLYVRGYPYMSQDAEAIVCAHVALWGVCRYLSQRFSIYREIYPYDFISLTSAFRGRTVPYRGMTYADFSEILTRFGCHPVVIHKPEQSKGDHEDIYAYVESGFPTLASSGAHVVTIIGHTLNRERSFIRNSLGLINSCQFVENWIVVDDNVFPYQKMKWEGPDPDYGKMYRKNEDPNTDISFRKMENFVVPLPERVFLTANRAAKVFQDYIVDTENQREVTVELKTTRDGSGLVTRQFITTGTALKREVLRRYKQEKNNIFADIIEMPLPHFVWVMELATVSGYSQDKKSFGEIVLDATANEHSTESVLFARVRNHLVVGQFIREGTGNGEFPQFSHNLSSTDKELNR